MGKEKRGALALCTLGLALLFAVSVLPRPAKPARRAQPAAREEGPLSGKTIAVDAGHGGADGGARARDSRIWEKTLNLSVAKRLQSVLEARGASVILTRADDRALDSVKRADLKKRMALATEHQADALLSIHMNEYRSRRESGPQVFYRAGQEASRLLAGAVQGAMIAALDPPKRRVSMAGDYYILSLPIPSVLVECGFLSNAAEEKLLLTDEYQARLAEAIARGVEEYFKLTGEYSILQ